MAFDVVSAVLTSDDPAALMAQIQGTAAWDEIREAAMGDPRFEGSPFAGYVYANYPWPGVTAAPDYTGPAELDAAAWDEIAQQQLTPGLASGDEIQVTPDLLRHVVAQKSGEQGTGDLIEQQRLTLLEDLLGRPEYQTQQGLDEIGQFLAGFVPPTASIADTVPFDPNRAAGIAAMSNRPLQDATTDRRLLSTNKGSVPSEIATGGGTVADAPFSPADMADALAAMAGYDWGPGLGQIGQQAGDLLESGAFPAGLPDMGGATTPAPAAPAPAAPAPAAPAPVVRPTTWRPGAYTGGPIQDIVTGGWFTPTYEGQRTAADVTSLEDIMELLAIRYANDPYYTATSGPEGTIAQQIALTNQQMAGTTTPEGVYQPYVPTVRGEDDPPWMDELNWAGPQRLGALGDRILKQLQGGGDNPFWRTEAGLGNWLPTGAPAGGTTGALGTTGGTGTYDYQGWDTLGDALGAFADYDWGGAGIDPNMGDLAGQYLEAGAWPVGIGDDTFEFRTDAPIGGANELYGLLAGTSPGATGNGFQYGSGTGYGTGTGTGGGTSMYGLTAEQRLAQALAEITRRAQYMNMDAQETMKAIGDAYATAQPKMRSLYAARGLQDSGLRNKGLADLGAEYGGGGTLETKVGTSLNRALGDLAYETMGGYGDYFGGQATGALQAGSDAARAAIAPELRKLLI
jgi:hypothetical protein